MIIRNIRSEGLSKLLETINKLEDQSIKAEFLIGIQTIDDLVGAIMYDYQTMIAKKNAKIERLTKELVKALRELKEPLVPGES